MERKIKSMKKLLSVMMCIALLLSIPMKAEAKDELRLMQYFSTKETLQLYIGGETEIQSLYADYGKQQAVAR